MLNFTKCHSRLNIYLKLRNTGSVSAFSKKNPVFPAVDILGTIIALNWPANKGLFMPTARPTEFDCSSKPVMFHWNVATLPGAMGGVTWSVMDKMVILAREQALLPFRSSAPRGFAARSHVLAKIASLVQIGELARRLCSFTPSVVNTMCETIPVK